MAHRVLSLKHRPQNFDELTGQSHVALSLKGAIKSGRIGHAFLFAGPRGVGKTTTARILAKSLNCIEGPTVYPCQQCQSCREITNSRSIDVVEIDGASNRGIEEIRNLRESVKYSPLQGRCKIYIIDEVHMLTQEAFNALLKTLEEPPPSVVFIFATTNPTKIPTTILSRCQRFVFKRLSVKEISSRLCYIADKENIKISKAALHHIAVRADGSIRDGESILEQLASFVESEITEEDVFKLVGFLSSSFYFSLLNEIIAKNLSNVIGLLNQGVEEGADSVEIYRGFTNYLRAALLINAEVNKNVIELSNEEFVQLEKMQLSVSDTINMLEICLGAEEMIKRSVNTRVALELLFSQLVMYMKTVKKAEKQNVVSRNCSNASNPAPKPGMKEGLYSGLQKNSPKLAGIIHKAEMKRDGDVITIYVDSEFSKRHLTNSQGQIKSVLKDVLDYDPTVKVELAQKKESDSDLIKTIKALFDGEEVR